MRQSQSSDSSAGSYSSGGASSAASQDNAEALDALQQGDEGEDLAQNDKGALSVVFGMIYILSKNKSLNTSIRFAAFQLVVEFLQFFLVLFNTTKAWGINTEMPLFKAIQWILFKSVVAPKGYSTYITVFYVIAVSTTLSQLVTLWIAIKLRGGDTSSKWMNRLMFSLQLMAGVVFTFWPTLLDYFVFAFDCQWSNLATGGTAKHMTFTEQNCLALPHLGHMAYAAFGLCSFACMIVLWTVGTVDMNPLTRSLLASSDIGAVFRITALKISMVVVGVALDSVPKVQAVLLLLAVDGVAYYYFWQLPLYNTFANLIYSGIWSALVGVSALLVGLVFTLERHLGDASYAARTTQVVLYILPFCLFGGAGSVWLRMKSLRPASRQLHTAFNEYKLAAAMRDKKAVGVGSSAVAKTGDLKKVYRFKDVTQLSVLCREMRKWDEDGVPDPETTEYGDFLLKCGMARIPNNPTILVMYASLLVEVNKDGQAAHTQLELAQKSNPSLLEKMQIYMAQQLAKHFKHEGDGLDLLGYVEYQRHYRACVKAHKLALMAQRQFWNSLLRDTVHFADLKRTLDMMSSTEAKATTIYRRVLERYPNNGKLLKAYGRFLEFVRNEPWAANKFYAEAAKLGTSESLLSLAQGQRRGNDIVSVTGTINEKVDGLVLINAQGQILMVNAAVLGMFGYEKGELEGKNVSVLMPQPFSMHHNTFLNRYVTTGVPHILDTSREVLGLHKDRAIFPFALMAMQLSGTGDDTLFFGVMRRPESTAGSTTHSVRFWTNASGVIMCADSSTEAVFGVSASQLVGRQFTSLCSDAEPVQEWISTAASREDGDSLGQVQATMLHAYLPAVDVELGIQFGGAVEATSECRFMIIEAQLLSCAGDVMALNQKGRLVYVTDRLAGMLGYPPSALVKMDLNALLPPPFSQIHGSWFKNLDRRPGPSSCRAGGVVHLLAANGTKLPVTLKMSIKEGSEATGLLHIIHVEKATDDELLNQRCLLLSVNHQGTILDVNTGATKRLYGFDPSDIVGRPLASVIDAFGYWRHQFGEDQSLLTLLALQAMQSGKGDMHGSHQVAGASWRVGVHMPVKADGDISAHAAQVAAEGRNKQAQGNSFGGSADSILQALRQRDRLQAACMSASLLDTEGRLLQDVSTADTLPIMQVALYLSDALSSVAELDKDLNIIHGDASLSLMFGIAEKHLHKKSFPQLAGLPAFTTFEDLLGIKGSAAGAKKGAMKASTAAPGAAGMLRMGVVKKITARHWGDGGPLPLEIQAMSHEQGGKLRLQLYIKLLGPTSASFSALVQLKQAAAEGSSSINSLEQSKLLLTARTAAAELSGADGSESEDDRGSKSGGKGPARGSAGGSQRTDPGSRTSDWVQQAAIRDGSHAGMRTSNSEVEATVYVSASQPSKGPKGAMGHTMDGKHYGAGKWGPERVGDLAESASMGGSAGVGEGDEGDIQSISEATGEANGHDDDLAMDARRAKRLKKLNRMMQSSIVQQASNRWRVHTLILMAVIVVAHIVSYVVLTTSVNSRYQTSYNVADMAHAIDKFLAVAMRAHMIQRCYLPQFTSNVLCSSAQLQIYNTKFAANINLAKMYHQNLYLGNGALKAFEDPRIMDYWTHYMLPELVYHETELLPNGTVVHGNIVSGGRPLWEMGNAIVAYARDVLYYASTWKDKMNSTEQFNYVSLNGINVFTGYAWSLDTYVEYAWTNLLKMSVLLLAMLVLEAIFVQCTCLLYEFYLLMKCNVSHIRLFSVFLALPSATVRIMAQRQLQVDDDTRNNAGDDEVDMDVAAQATAAGEMTAEAGEETGAATADKKKSVRMEANLADDDDADDDADRIELRKTKRSSTTGAGQTAARSKSKSAAGGSSSKTQLTGVAHARHVAYKKLFAWMDPKFKRNGKKLAGDSAAVWRLMVPLGLWLVAVVVISAISYHSLKGLEGPLVSLDTATHVLYHGSICRLIGNLLAYGVSPEEKMGSRFRLRQELDLMKQEYNTLLYGGRMLLKANVTFNPVAPVGVFTYGPIADLFFKTTECLRRNDRNGCFNDPTHPYYDITHAGLDAMVNRYIDVMTMYASLPDNLTGPSDPSYIWAQKVAATDLADGLQTAADLFLEYTIIRFEAVKRFHVVLLVISLLATALFILVLYRPYIKQLARDSKALVGMMSQLPAEVDVEGHFKSIILGLSSKSSGNETEGQSMIAVPQGSMLSLSQPGYVGPSGYLPGVPGAVTAYGQGGFQPGMAYGVAQGPPPVAFNNGWGSGPGFKGKPGAYGGAGGESWDGMTGPIRRQR